MDGIRPRWFWVGLTSLVVGLGTSAAQAQEPGVPLADAAVPTASPPVVVGAVETAGTGNLEQRIQQLEGLLRQMTEASVERERRMEGRIQQLESQLAAPSAAPAAAPDSRGFVTGGSAASPFTGKELGRGSLGMATTAKKSSDMPAAARNIAAAAKFGPGFQVASEDEEWVLQFHNLTQIDGRFYEQRAGSAIRMISSASPVNGSSSVAG